MLRRSSRYSIGSTSPVRISSYRATASPTKCEKNIVVACWANKWLGAASVWSRYSSFKGKSATESNILSTIFRCSAVDVPLRRRISSATRARPTCDRPGPPCPSCVCAFQRRETASHKFARRRRTPSRSRFEISSSSTRTSVKNVCQEGFNTFVRLAGSGGAWPMITPFAELGEQASPTKCDMRGLLGQRVESFLRWLLY
jgi:hypothetical protein